MNHQLIISEPRLSHSVLTTSLASNGFEIDSSAIISDFNVGLVAAMVGSDFDHGFGLFALSGAKFGAFYAMIEGVADEVNEGIEKFFQDDFIYEGRCADQFDLDLFFVGDSEVTDHAGKAIEEI